MSVKSELVKDKVYLRAKKSLVRIQESLNVEETINEMFQLQPSRGVSALKPNKIIQSSVHILLDSTTQEIAVRSRVTTIKMTALRSKLSLEELIDPLKKHIMVKYGPELKKEGHTSLTSQRAYVDNILKKFLTETRNLDYVIRIADLIVEDVDQAGWGLKRIADVLESAKKDR